MSRIQRGLLIELCIVLVLAAAVALGLKAFNRKLGPQPSSRDRERTEAYPAAEDTLMLPEMEPVVPRADTTMKSGPETSWEATPCSIFTSVDPGLLVDTLPQAPGSGRRPYEAQLIVRRWAEANGLSGDRLDEVYVFNRSDTLYVDVPMRMDVSTLKRTVESRFVCFTRLYLLVSGNLQTGLEDGIALRGVPGAI
ncbi:hypothetical protein GF402_05185 [Candidatus Fermentibacteria bacterium]|nr:hypothetical protein [Candidatus Fermentibacteria bacterium]